MPGHYRFSFGPWNIHEGADPFGPPVRASFAFDEKLEVYRTLGFEGVQFHDDDVVPGIDRYPHTEVLKMARDVKKRLDDLELVAEFVAPRLWEDARTIDGAYTSNDEGERRYAIERSVRAVEIARELGSDRIVLWLAREGTYLREAKDPSRAVERIVLGINKMLAADKGVKILIEPKPNEPMDLAYLPTMGHAVATAYLSDDPARVGGLVESAHAILAGLDPSDEMAFALRHKKLWSVHLNDQNGLKYDQDKAFGSVDLRRAFNQVRVLERHDYGAGGEWVGLDVKALRTQRRETSFAHLKHSKETFLLLLEKARTLDEKAVEALTRARDYEALDQLILRHLLGAGDPSRGQE
ncbi:MAG TPA: TIM barrel protein [Planctomycetota bacterium]|nr:TIM barrel protein [Planctomycetota bacterium]